VLNAYFRMGHNPGGFRIWWRALTGSDETLENAYLMRMAGRFSRRIRGYAKAHGIPVIDCSAGQRKHDLAEEYLAKTTVTQGLFLVLVGRAQAPVWDVSGKHHIERNELFICADNLDRMAALAEHQPEARVQTVRAPLDDGSSRTRADCRLVLLRQ
jgi:hypothetical protein